MLWLQCSGYREDRHLNNGDNLCNKKLLKYSDNLFGNVEIKCSRCGTINELNGYIEILTLCSGNISSGKQ